MLNQLNLLKVNQIDYLAGSLGAVIITKYWASLAKQLARDYATICDLNAYFNVLYTLIAFDLKNRHFTSITAALAV